MWYTIRWKIGKFGKVAINWMENGKIWPSGIKLDGKWKNLARWQNIRWKMGEKKSGGKTWMENG